MSDTKALIDEIARLLQQLRDADAARTQALESRAQEIRALHIETYELGEELAAMRIILNQVAPDRLVQHDREFSVQMRSAVAAAEELARARAAGARVVDLRRGEERSAGQVAAGALHLQWDGEAGAMPTAGLPDDKAAPIILH
ncbi:unnamed protein product [Prorocentrum cordatum]|uniref:Uncharacterized protein n=1 Tax=Prorocentrum cordatum TaxID=2364126 RepID=A0ABN9VCU2_9DINO|nr:unnamed protein product [Polarella glacialis]